ncbi:hypothetical protein M405DRAFT_352974 [Rhizopogon salebrosus TDB-379]|nr:hypothetical protein M405DRAFT_352974 [Rhizopogon salebrosus TDB-379]
MRGCSCALLAFRLIGCFVTSVPQSSANGPLDVEVPAVRYVSLGSFRSPSPLTSVQALDINVCRWPEPVTDMVIRIKNVVHSLYFVHLLHMCLRRQWQSMETM